MFHFVTKTLFICIFIFFNVKAESEEDLKKVIIEVLVKCSEEYPPTPDEIEMLKAKKLSGSDNLKCMFACAYKKTGMMNEKGEMCVKGIQKLSDKYFVNNPEKAKKATEFVEACKSVNDEKVSDGEKGCERAALLFKCTVEKAAEFDLTE